MYPPAWAVADSTRLDLEGFGSAFANAWSRIEFRFLKLECWQAYREAETNESQAAYDCGDIEAARRLLTEEAEGDRRLYEDVRRRGIEYARVRLVREPLTRYLDYELLSFRIRAEMGENIEIVRCDPAQSLPDEQHFDLLLFDRRTALIHDYGSDEVGFQVGGWISQDPQVVERLEDTVMDLRRRGTPLGQFLARM